MTPEERAEELVKRWREGGYGSASMTDEKAVDDIAAAIRQAVEEERRKFASGMPVFVTDTKGGSYTLISATSDSLVFHRDGCARDIVVSFGLPAGAVGLNSDT